MSSRPKNLKQCPVCKKWFPCPPSDKTVTCSKECSHIHRSRVHQGISNVWGQNSRQRQSALGITDNLKKGTPCALESPKSGHFETNINAKDWHIVSPDGKHYKFRNLNLWSESNYCLFGFDSPSDSRKVSGGIRLAKRAANGKKVSAYTYKGWRVIVD